MGLEALALSTHGSWRIMGVPLLPLLFRSIFQLLLGALVLRDLLISYKEIRSDLLQAMIKRTA